MYVRTAKQFPDYKHKQHLSSDRGGGNCRSCSTRGSLISPGSVLSEDSGVGSEEDLAWDDGLKYVQEDKTIFSELSRPIKQRARSLDELTGSLSIDCTIPLLVPPVQYQDEKQGGRGEKELEAAGCNSSKHSNYFKARQALKKDKS